MSRIYSAQGLIADTLSINVDTAFLNFTAVVQFYSDEFITPVEATAGTATVSGHIPGAFSNTEFNGSPIDATDGTAYSSAGIPLDAVVSSTAGITGATHYKLTVTATK